MEPALPPDLFHSLRVETIGSFNSGHSGDSPAMESKATPAAEVRALLGADWAAISFLDERDQARWEVALSESFSRSGMTAEMLREILRKRLPVGGEPGAERTWRLELPDLLPGTDLRVVSLCDETRPAGMAHSPGAGVCESIELGKMVVGLGNRTGKQPAPAPDGEMLTAVARRLSEVLTLRRAVAEIHMRDRFLSIASHELKTPLTSIYGMLQLQERMARGKLTGDPEAEREKQRFFLKKIIRQVERLNELIDGLLNVSRIQNGRFMVEPSTSDVAGILRDAIASRLDVLAVEQGVKIHVDGPERLMAWVDPVRMEEVVTNLVMNAIRFSPEGGVVWVKLRHEGDSFRLIVRDQGPSIPMDDRERIFHPFERAQRTGRLGGLGLGLYISRQIAWLHGGNVSLVESVPGKGNTFEAHFPVRSANVTASAV